MKQNDDKNYKKQQQKNKQIKNTVESFKDLNTFFCQLISGGRGLSISDVY